MHTVPGSASASSRAAMLTPSPKMSAPSTITSPRLTPIRSSRRRSGGMGSLMMRATCCASTAQLSASTTLQEIGQQAVACRTDNPPAVCRDQRVDGGA